MNANSSSRISTVDHIADTLIQDIVQGHLEGGSPLRQDHIAEQFMSSHVPVREALLRLQALGLAVSLPRRGMRVSELSLESIKETVVMRAALESLALRHSAPHFTVQHIANLESIHQTCNEAQSLAEWDAANSAFHHALTRHCGMPRMLEILYQLQLSNSRYLFTAGKLRSWQPRSDHDHRLIIDALKQGNTERAVQLLGRHIGTMERVGFFSGQAQESPFKPTP